MTVVVSFVTPKGIRSVHAPGIGAVRIRENITIPGTTTATLLDGEIAVIGNGENSMVAVAFGTSPNADAVASTAATSAGVAIPAGQSVAIAPNAGDKINVKAVS